MPHYSSLLPMLPLLTILVLPFFSTHTNAKFSTTYPGIATDGVHACLEHSSLSFEQLTSPDMCREAFQCVMENIPNYAQSILGSGAAILGFIPTVLLVLGCTNAQLVRINARYPLLAVLLGLMSVNKRMDGVEGFVLHGRGGADPGNNGNMNAKMVSLGPYGSVAVRESSRQGTRASRIGIWAVHVFALVGAGVIVWQTVEIARNGVVSWACWTEFYPEVWIVWAVVHHLLAVLFMRLSLKVNIPTPQAPPARRATSKTKQPTRQATRQPTRQPPARTSRSALLVWDLTQEGLDVEFTRKRFAKWSKATTDLVNNVNYLYGTAVFSSLTLVSGRVAIQKLACYGFIALVARMMSVWVLEDMGEE